MIKKQTKKTVSTTAPKDVEIKIVSEKEELLKLYQILKDKNINSISDLENLIARAE